MSSPLTEIFEQSLNDTCLAAQNSLISLSLPGSWLPKLFAGKATISRPLSLYCLYSVSRPAYCLSVSPQRLATLTMRTGLPLRVPRSSSLPSMSLTLTSWMDFGAAVVAFSAAATGARRATMQAAASAAQCLTVKCMGPPGKRGAERGAGKRRQGSPCPGSSQARRPGRSHSLRPGAGVACRHAHRRSPLDRGRPLHRLRPRGGSWLRHLPDL